MGRGPGDGPTRQLWPLSPEIALEQGGANKVFMVLFSGSREDEVRSTTIDLF